MLQLEKYKKHYLLLTQKGGLDMSEMSYDYLSAWCAKEMDTVFGKGWAVSRLSLKAMERKCHFAALRSLCVKCRDK